LRALENIYRNRELITELRVEVFGPGCSATAFVPIVQEGAVQKFITAKKVSCKMNLHLAEDFVAGLCKLFLALYSLVPGQENECFMHALENKIKLKERSSDPRALLQEHVELYLRQQPGGGEMKNPLSGVPRNKAPEWCKEIIRKYLAQCLVFSYPET